MHLKLMPEVENLLLALKARYVATCAIDGWLCTHAGLHPYYQGHFPTDAETIEKALNEKFLRDPYNPIFSSIGPLRSRERDSRPGGIFWIDFSELSSPQGHRLKQIVGHTRQMSDKPIKSGDLWCVDCSWLSGKLAGLVKELDSDWEPVSVDRAEKPRDQGLVV